MSSIGNDLPSDGDGSREDDGQLRGREKEWRQVSASLTTTRATTTRARAVDVQERANRGW